MGDAARRGLRRRMARFAAVSTLAVGAAWGVLGPPSFAAQPTVDAQLEIVSIADDPETVLPGGTLTYTIVATNRGPSGVFAGVVTVELPPEVVFRQVTGSTATAGVGTQTFGRESCPGTATLVCAIGPMLGPPASAGGPGPTTVTLEVTVDVVSAAEVDRLPKVITTVATIDATDVGLTIKGDTDDENTTIAAPSTTTVTTTPPQGSIRVTVDADNNGSFGLQEGPVPPGTAVRFRADIANTGGSPLTIAAIQDSLGGLAGLAGCASPPAAVIAAGDTARCEFNAPVTGQPGSVVANEVTVTAGDGSTFSDAAFVTVAVAPAPPRITVSLRAAPSTVQAPGGQVTYAVEVGNLTNQPLDLVQLTDTILGSLDGAGSCRAGAALAPDGNYACSYTAQVSGAAGATVANTVTAVARDAAGMQARDDDDATVVVVPEPTPPRPGGLSVSVTPAAAPPEGTSTATWQVTVAAGTSPVTLASLAADRTSTIGSCPTGGLIDRIPYTCTFSSPVPVGNAGDRVGITVTAASAAGGVASGSGIATFDDVQPDLAPLTVTSPGSVLPGTELPVNVTVTNASDASTDPVDVVSISLDGVDRTASCSIGRLQRGATSQPCTVPLLVDAAVGTTVAVQVVVRGRDDEGNVVTASGTTSATVRTADEFTLDMVLVDAEASAPGELELLEPGDVVDTPFRYAVIVVNRDTGAASLPAVTVELPAEVRLAAEGCEGTSNSILLTVEGELQPGEQATAAVDVVPCSDVPKTVVATASVAGQMDEETTPVRGGDFGDRSRGNGGDTNGGGTNGGDPDEPVFTRVAGTVFFDTDGDGVLDRPAGAFAPGEEGLGEGIIVELTTAAGAVLVTPTGDDGAYAFPDPVEEPAEVRVDPDTVPRGLEPTSATVLEVEVGSTESLDFGFWQEGSVPPGTDDRPSNVAAWGVVALGLGAVGAAEAAFGLHAIGRLPRRRP